MAKEKKPNIPKPIHFPLSESQAKARFEELVAKGCHPDLFLIYSAHWSGLGFWIYFEPLPDSLTGSFGNGDKLISHKHNSNPKPWTPPKRNEPRELDEDDEDEE